jgi:hypothetical protein
MNRKKERAMTDDELTITVDGVSDDDRALQARALQRTLGEALPDVTVSRAAEDRKPGEKGDPITLGTIALALVTSGAVGALIGCLKATISRDRHVKLKIRLGNGRTVDIDAKNIDQKEVRQLLEDSLPRNKRGT